MTCLAVAGDKGSDFGAVDHHMEDGAQGAACGGDGDGMALPAGDDMEPQLIPDELPSVLFCRGVVVAVSILIAD